MPVVGKNGVEWCMVLVTRQDDTDFLDIVPYDKDAAVLGVFAWAAFPMAKTITHKGVALVNPVKPGAFQ